MRRLSRTVVQGEMEPVTSFLSRLALRNRCPSPSAFCSDMGLDPARIRSGVAEEIERLADLAGADAAALRHWSVRSVESGGFVIPGGAITPHGLRRHQVRFCPDCIAAGLAAHDGLPPRWLPWKLVSLRSCPWHNRPLLTLPGEGGLTGGRDFARTVISSASAAVGPAEPRLCSAFEHHLVDRIREVPATGWFDRFPLRLACQVAETLGVLLLQGPDGRMGPQDEDALHRAGQAGYAVLSAGPEALTAALEALIPPFNGTRGSHMQTFGALYAFLAPRARDPDLAPLIGVVRPLILENFAISDGTMLLGTPAPSARLYTIHTARTRLGLGTKALSTLLIARGLAVRDDGTGLARPPYYMDRAVLEDIRRELDQMIDERTAAKRLGVGVDLLHRLVAEGLVTREADPGFGDQRYRTPELDQLHAALCQTAGPIAALGEGQICLVGAAQRLHMPAAGLLRLLRDGHLRCRGLLQGQMGLSALVLDISETTAMIAASPDRQDSIPRAELGRRLGLTRATLLALIDRGNLALCPDPRLSDDRGYPLIDRGTAARFEAEHVSLSRLAADRGRHHGALRMQLRCQGVERLPLPPNCNHIYRRDDIAAWDAARAAEAAARETAAQAADDGQTAEAEPPPKRARARRAARRNAAAPEDAT